MSITENTIRRLAQVGQTFHSHDVMSRIDMDFEQLFLALRRLQAKGVIRFTGRICVWERLK